MVFGLFGKSDEKIQELIDNKQFDELPIEVIDELGKELIVTTETTLSGYEIEDRIDIVTAECVFGMNIFRDMFAGIRDIFGGRSSASQKVLRDARRTSLTELRREALIAGANAVIAVDLDYSEISGDGKSMLLVVVSGTACRVRKA
ncbi:MAG: YbjQ family protein [Rhodospirillaceae bacterium]|jgi:uncharacterized protein YbjQ (UPF0145 family)|nr:YbjQ family protein [Rhodospirillaceae bacterium]